MNLPNRFKVKMEKSAFLYLCLIFACLPSFLFGNVGEMPDPEEISKEMYCIGCEYTVKAIHNMMEEESDEKLDERAAETLQSVCSEEYFKGSEYPVKKLVAACEFLIEKNGELMDPLLVTHYSHTKGGSYLDLSQQLCLDLSKACFGVDGAKRYPDHLDSDLHYDPKSKTFRVKPGRNIRVPDPVKVKEDL